MNCFVSYSGFLGGMRRGISEGKFLALLGQTSYVCRSLSDRLKSMLGDVDGPPSLELLRRGAVSYSIALWSSVAAFTIWDWP
ncbi:hypothetical protein SLA2020_516580 [Shorea laevis]